MCRLHAFVISPHRDDAALSMSATLAWLSLQGVRITVISCFTVSEWAPLLGAGVSRAQLTAIRKAEDERYIAQLGDASKLVSIGLLDGPLRPDWKPYKTWPEIDDNPVVEAVCDLLKEKLTINAVMRGAWFLPLALEHRDHLIARTAALCVAQGQPLLFYEDVPYVFWFGEDDVRSRVAQVEQRVGCNLQQRILHTTADLEAWYQAVGAYRSQFSQRQIDSMYRLLRRRGGERVWVTPSLLQWLDSKSG